MKAIPPVPPCQRIVARWLLTPLFAACECHYGIFVYADGTVGFYDIFSHRVIHDWDDTSWLDRFWIREILDEFTWGEEAELICRYSRTITLKRAIIRQIMRANERGIYSLEGASEELFGFAAWIESKLSDLFWEEISPFMIYLPKRREILNVPIKPFPTKQEEVILNVPVDLAKPWWESEG